MYEVLFNEYAPALSLGIWILRFMDTEIGSSFSRVRAELQCLRKSLPDASNTISLIGRKDTCQDWYGCFAERDVLGLGTE